MRFLHTADWHVGKTLRGRSRQEEFAAVLDEVIGIAAEENVDAVLVAGDVYEHRAPSPEADELVFDALLRLHDAGIRVVVIAGNHDSAVRMGALAGVLARIGVTLVPRVVPPEEGSAVEIPARDGAEAAVVACVPFVPERRFGDAAALFHSVEDWYQSYAENMGRLLEAMAAAFREDRVNELLAHLFTDGALLGGGEREATIGLEYAVSPARLPGNAQYLALGHVHRPQRVRGAPAAARFAGSLLQLDFGETQQEKSVAVIEASPGKPARVREIPLRSGRRLVDVRGSLDELAAAAGDIGDAYLRVFVSCDGPTPGLAERVREVLPGAVDVHLEYDRAEAEPGAPALSSLAPRDQFLAYYRSHHGAEPADDLLRAFDEVLAGAAEESG